jgi:hypothetical protein
VLSSQFEAPGQPRNPGYTVVNAAAAYRLPIKRWGFLSNITLHVRATNLFNEDYAEVAGFPALGTWVVGGIPRHLRLSRGVRLRLPDIPGSSERAWPRLSRRRSLTP